MAVTPDAAPKRRRIGCLLVTIILAVVVGVIICQVRAYLRNVEESKHCLIVCYYLRDAAYRTAEDQGPKAVTPEALHAALPWSDGPGFWQGDDGTHDLWGNPLTVQVEEAAGMLRVAVRSAGRDGRFGTPDDIRYHLEWPWPPALEAQQASAPTARS
jgi:hypothetical protein